MRESLEQLPQELEEWTHMLELIAQRHGDDQRAPVPDCAMDVFCA